MFQSATLFVSRCKIRPLRALVGDAFSNLGTLVQTVAAGWLMASLTPSQDMVALVQSSNTFASGCVVPLGRSAGG